MKFNCYIFSLALLFCTLPGKAQLFTTYNIKFKNYTTQDGLVHNYTRKCRLDSKGFLWIITQNGLSRFDGYQFKNFQHLPGDSNTLPFNDILDMDIDNQDRIWLAHAKGICYYDPKDRKFHAIKNAKESSCLAYDKFTQSIWYCSQYEGLFRIRFQTMRSEETKLSKAFPHIPYCMTIDSRKRIWIGIERNWTYCYDIAADSFRNTNNHTWARDFWEDEDGNVWASLWGAGLHCIRPNDSVYYYHPEKDFPGLFTLLHGTAKLRSFTGDSILWVITHNVGLLLFNKNTGKFIKSIRYKTSMRSGMLNDYNSTIYTDRNGILWICNWYGLSKVNPQEQQFHSEELPELRTDLFNMVAGIVDDPYEKNHAWSVICGQGLAKYNKTSGEIEQWYFHDFNRDYDWTWPINLTIDKNKVLWCSSYGGFVSVDKGRVEKHPVTWNGIYTYPNGYIRSRDDNLWLFTDEGLVEFHPSDKSFKVHRNTDSVRSRNDHSFGQFQQIDDRTFLVTSLRGLYKFDLRTHQFTMIPLKNINQRLMEIELIGDYAYLGGQEGLIKYHVASGKFEKIGEQEGITNLGYGSLIQDHRKNLWIYAINGLYRYEPANGKFKKFTAADGVYYNSNDRAELFSYNNKIFIGYRGAYTSFDPDKIDINNNLVVPYITDIKFNNTPLPLGADSTGNRISRFNYRKNSISFEYTGIDYTNSERITFQYKLDGFDKDWIDAGTNRVISYSNLQGGHYTFMLKASNSSGVWNEEPAVFKFYIIPPLTQRLWFKALIIAAIASLLYLLYRLRIRQLRNKQRDKTFRQQLEIEKYKQELEIEQVNSFFSESLIHKNDTKEVLEEVAKNLIGKLGFDDCMIYLWNDDKTRLVQTAGYGTKGEVRDLRNPERFNIDPGTGIVGATVAGGKPILVNDTSMDSRYRTADDMIRGSELCVPLLDEGEVIGAINIEQAKKDHFTAHHVRIVSAIATMVVSKLKAVQSTQSLYQKERQLAETELAMLRSQMNPHFIFNSLNSVQKYIWENKEEDAAEYLAKFAKLMRAILENSRKEFVTVGEEIETMKIYTDLEHRRSNGRFDYTIRIAEDVNPEKTLIPPMLLQPFIENAIWHGLNKKDTKGHLHISVHRENQQLICIVDDDGVGRSGAKDSGPEKRSLGIEITRQRIERLMQSTGKKPTIIITDKKESDQPSGTKVTITLPIQTN